MMTQTPLQNFCYNGKFFDTGPDAKMACALCHRNIRYVYTLVEEGNERNRLHIGTCCFAVFQPSSEKLYQALLAAHGYHRVRVEAKESAIDYYGRRSQLRAQAKAWRGLRRQALTILRDYRRQSGKEWLPEPLFELHILAQAVPSDYKRFGNRQRWYEKQIQQLQRRLVTL